MRDDIYQQTHPVKLEEVEVRAKYRTAASCWKRLDEKDAEIEKLKSDHKDALKRLEGEAKQIKADARAALTCAENGEEPRLVDVREELHGSTVITIRCDTEETVHERAATEPELRAAEEERKKKAKAPASADEMRQRIIADAVKLCAKPRTEAALKKMLQRGIPQATEKEIAAGVLAAIQANKIEEVDEKLVVVKAPQDDGIVDDNYGRESAAPPVQ